MFQGLTRLRELVDSLRRRTAPQDWEAHEMFTLSLAACDETIRLEQEIGKAWSETNHEVWREFAGKALQSLVMMTGVKAGEKPGTLVPVAEGVKAEDVPDELARLADLYASALMKRDVAKRKETKAA